MIAAPKSAAQVGVTGRITLQLTLGMPELSPLLVLVRHDLGQRALAHSVVDEVTMRLTTVGPTVGHILWHYKGRSALAGGRLLLSGLAPETTQLLIVCVTILGNVAAALNRGKT